RTGREPLEGRPRRQGAPSGLRARGHGDGGAGGGALVSPALQRVRGSLPPDRMVRAAQPGPRPGPAGRKTHRLHCHRRQRRRNGHTVLYGRPAHPSGVRGIAQTERRDQPYGSRVVQAPVRQVSGAMNDGQGGRIFFSNMGRSLEEEDEIRLVSVGVDIGSSTSHLVFSRIVLERLDNRYIVSERVVLHESDVLLTPYAHDQTIDAAALGAFIDRQYELAGVEPCNIDTVALILTGVAVLCCNAMAIGELFASQAG